MPSVADPDPGLGAFLIPGSGIRDGRKSASGSGIRNEQTVSYFLELRNHFFAFWGVKILKFFDEDPGSGMETVRIRDGKKSVPGSRINIPDPQHCICHSRLYPTATVSEFGYTRCARGARTKI
jgi:hypothetical protein